MKDVICYLKAVDNGLDDLAVKRIINVPRRGIGATTIDKVQTYAIERNIGFLDACFQARQIESLANAKRKIEKFCKLIADFREQAQKEILKTCFTISWRRQGT